MPICGPCSPAIASRSRCRCRRSAFTSIRSCLPCAKSATSASRSRWWSRESRRLAEDAASLVALDLEPLPAVLDPRAGLARDAPRARLDCPDNLVAHWVVKYGDIERAFAGAAHRISERFRIHKGGGHSIEARGVVARYDPAEDLLTVWDSTQMPHKAKRVLVEALGLAEAPAARDRARCRRRLRAQEPVLSGGAGSARGRARCSGARSNGSRTGARASPPPTMSASRTGRSRRRSSADGKLLAIRGHLRHDHGACTPSGPSLPQNATTNLLGPYVLPALSARSLALPHQPGAGDLDARRRPAARHLRHGAAARPHRRRARACARRGAPAQSHPAARRCPTSRRCVTRDGLPMTYDSGDYLECQRRALAAAGWTDFPARREAARRAGPPARHRACELRRGHRPRPVRERRACASGRRARSWSPPAPPRRARARTPCWRSSSPATLGVAPAAHPRHRRRHRGKPARPRRLCQPAGGDRRQCRASRRPHGRRQGARRPHPRCWKSRPTISSCFDGACACAACRSSSARSARSRMRSAALPGFALPATSRRGLRPRSISSRRR